MCAFYLVILLTYWKAPDLFIKFIIILIKWWHVVSPEDALAISQLIVPIKFSWFYHKAQLINFNYFWNAAAEIQM